MLKIEKSYKNKKQAKDLFYAKNEIYKVKIIDESEQEVSYLIAKGKHISVQDGDTIEKGEYLIDGNPAPHDILSILGLEALASYLVNEIQSVYRLQGVTINDKHIEVITRQMLQKVLIKDPGESNLIAGEQIQRRDVLKLNKILNEKGKKVIEFEPVLLGITKASLQTGSFISAASFQETTKVLTDAATLGKIDPLNGLKENVIVGRLIPAGTGKMTTDYENLAIERDNEVISNNEAENIEN